MRQCTTDKQLSLSENIFQVFLAYIHFQKMFFSPQNFNPPTKIKKNSPHKRQLSGAYKYLQLSAYREVQISFILYETKETIF